METKEAPSDDFILDSLNSDKADTHTNGTESQLFPTNSTESSVHDIPVSVQSENAGKISEIHPVPPSKKKRKRRHDDDVPDVEHQTVKKSVSFPAPLSITVDVSLDGNQSMTETGDISEATSILESEFEMGPSLQSISVSTVPGADQSISQATPATLDTIDPLIMNDTGGSETLSDTEITLDGTDEVEELSSDDAPLTVEAKEERLLERYRNLLGRQKILLSSGNKPMDFSNIQRRFENLLRDVSYVTGDSENNRMKALYCAVLKNLSNICQRQKDFAAALSYLTQVADLDYTDVVMMHTMGELAIKQGNFPLAANFFQDALAVRPSHWPSLDALMTITYALNYLVACLNCCLSALRMEPSHQRALVFVQKMFEEHEFFKEEWFPTFKQVSKLVGKTLPATTKRYFDEAMTVKRRWWKPESSEEGDPAMRQLTVPFPVIAEWSFSHVGNLLLDLFEDLNTKKTCTALITAELPEENFEREVPSETMKPTDLPVSLLGIENSTQSGDDTNKGSQSFTGGSSAGKSKRRIDPVLLELTEKRRSARNKGTGRNDETVIRTMLKKSVKAVFGEVPDLCLPNPLQVVSSADELPVKPGHSLTRRMWELAEDEAREVRRYIKEVSGLRINGWIRGFLQYFAEHTQRIWPPSLAAMYIPLFYCIIHEEYIPSFLNYNPAAMEEVTRKIILLILCALEIVVDTWMKAGTVFDLPRDFEKHISYLELWTQSKDFSSQSDRAMHLRILMLLHKWHNLINSTMLSRHFFEELQKRLEEDTAVLLPNLTFLNDISKIALAKLTEVFETSGGLAELVALYQQKDYVQVVKMAYELLGAGRAKETAPAKEPEFEPTHVKMIITSFDKLDMTENTAQYVGTMELLLGNQLKQLLEVCENPDEEKKKRMDGCRSVVTDLCEILFRKTARSKTGFPCLNVDRLKAWASLLTELCILLVHKSDGSMRRPSSLSTWIMLHRVLRAGENLLPRSTENWGDAGMKYLEEVHEYLGGHSWCTTADGSFLHLAVKQFNHELNVRKSQPSGTPINSEISTDDLEYHLEQCFRCMYDVSKGKNRYFQHHKCSPVKLTLRRSIPLYQFFLPDELPAFDGYKSDCLSQEGVILFNKICPMITKVPSSWSREALQTFVRSYNPVKGFDLEQLPVGLDGASLYTDDPDLISQHLFYLLADYYFKTNDHKRAIRLYTSDLCINPRRLDSWAGLAMSRGMEVDQKLTSFKMKPSRELFEEAMETVKLYCIAAKIGKDSEKLHIECGSRLYVLHSYLSRQLAQSDQFRLRGTDKAKLREDRKLLLRLSQESFLSAEDCTERGETWLSQYMLGKTYEKWDKSDPSKYLAQYTAAAESLHLGGARYPAKIAYYKAPGLSVEALEMFYRTVASSLKYLCRSETLTTGGLKAVEFYLNKAEKSPFSSQIELDKDDSGASEDEETGPNFATKRVMESFVLDRLEIVSIPEKPTESWRLDLISRCVAGLRKCLTRYTEHYKSLYRLARLYYEFRPLRDLQKTRDLLLGPAISWTLCPHMPCAGLFQQRKPTCFFKGIWHIRSEDIQRSLSFASHMYRAIHLLICVSGELCDNLLLLQIHQQLAKPPDADAKKFLRVVDYHYLSSFAMKSALLSVINRVEDYETDACAHDVRVTFLREVLKVYQTARKENLDGKNMELANAMLAQAYLRLVENIHKTHCPVPTPQNIVDKAIRYIQQVQFRRPKVQAKPTVTMNLSSGLSEDAQSSAYFDPTVPGRVDSETTPVSVVSETPKTAPVLFTSQPVEDDRGAVQDEDGDLMGIDLGLNPAGMDLSDFSDIMMQTEEEEGDATAEQPSSAEG